jgi:predicted  nucleic acid-binding Zn-ribbon protein
MKPDDWWERNEREHKQFLERHRKAEQEMAALRRDHVESRSEMRELRALVFRLGRLSEAADQRWRDLRERLNALIVAFERHVSDGHA